MKCPNCGETSWKVIDTTETRTGVRRRRECKACGSRYSTVERIVATTPLLVKTDGTREEFDREKLKRGIRLACTKRSVSAAQVDQLAASVESYLQSLGRPEVESRLIGDKVIEGLKALDPIAYIRYAIVYLGLDDLGSVRAEIDKLLGESNETGEALPSYTEEQLIDRMEADTSSTTSNEG
jgi:transcriptional repressor NrdR